jgi:colanic acid biosynthesis glycosyl transferase WcaI
MTTEPLNFVIVGINYAPEITGCAPYNTDLAEKLASAGHKVTVIAGLPHYPEWKVPPEYKIKGSHTELINGVEVRRVKHFVPSNTSAITRGLYELTYLLNGLWHSRDLKPDIVLGVSPAWAGTAIAAVMKKRHGSVMKVLVQDLMAAAAEQSNIKGGARAARLVNLLEGWTLRHADSVGVITEQFKERVIAFGVPAEKIVITPNYSQSHIVPMDRDECREFWGWPKDEFIVMHTGNMGLKQDLGNVIEAARIAKISNPNMRFYLVGDGSQRESLVKQASRLDNVIFKNLVSNEDYSRLLGAADVLLINESPNQMDMSLPSKLTSYIAAQRTIVAACNEGSGTALAAQTAALLVKASCPDSLVSGLTVAFDASKKDFSPSNNLDSNLRLIWVLGNS